MHDRKAKLGGGAWAWRAREGDDEDFDDGGAFGKRQVGRDR